MESLKCFKIGEATGKETIGIEVPADGIMREATLGDEGAPIAKPAIKIEVEKKNL